MGGNAKAGMYLTPVISITGDHSNTPYYQVRLTLVSIYSQYFTMYPMVSTYVYLVHSASFPLQGTLLSDAMMIPNNS